MRVAFASLWCATTISVAAFPLNLAAQVTFCVAALLALVVITRSIRPFGLMMRWTLPFLLPIVLIHAFFNHTFPLVGEFAGIAYRPAGAAFGSTVALDVATLFIGITTFFFVSRDEFADWVLASGRGGALIMIGLQGVALAGQIERRARAVRLAQQARGIPLGPGPIRRMRALMSLVIPVVSSLIIEIEPRASALIGRGFAATRQRARNAPALRWFDCFGVLLPVAFASGACWLNP